MNSIFDNPVYEKERIEALRKYNILDTLTENDYDDITLLASTICDVPIALITFVDEQRQWFKSHTGTSVSETPREYSFCAHALRKPEETLIVQDSRTDERFKDNPLVTGEPGIVFYAGVPLVNEEGFGLGTVCVVDNKKRQLAPDQLKALQILSRQVMHLLELRKTNAELELVKRKLEIRNTDLQQFAMVVSHDIKSPLTTVLLANDLLMSDYGSELGQEGTELINKSTNSAQKIKSLVDGILSYYREDQQTRFDELIGLNDFFESFRNSIYSPREYILSYDFQNSHIFFNRTQLEQISLNLLTNSIRYNDKPVIRINIRFIETADEYHFSVTDNGIGIAEADYERIFTLFSTVSSVDNSGSKGSGIGLPTVKKIIENAGGKITVSSLVGQGTTVFFTLRKMKQIIPGNN